LTRKQKLYDSRRSYFSMARFRGAISIPAQVALAQARSQLSTSAETTRRPENLGEKQL